MKFESAEEKDAHHHYIHEKHYGASFSMCICFLACWHSLTLFYVELSDTSGTADNLVVCTNLADIDFYYSFVCRVVDSSPLIEFALQDDPLWLVTGLR